MGLLKQQYRNYLHYFGFAGVVVVLPHSVNSDQNIISHGDSLHSVLDAASRGRGFRIDLSALSNAST